MHIFAHPPEDATKRLLAEAALPTTDITAAHLARFFGCGPRSGLHGVVGLELYGEVGLLRSLAITPAKRGAGLGTALVAYAEEQAWKRGVQALYLLTATAEPFFVRLGYDKLSRDRAPAAIRDTQEFSTLCSAGAAFMVKQLGRQ